MKRPLRTRRSCIIHDVWTITWLRGNMALVAFAWRSTCRCGWRLCRKRLEQDRWLVRFFDANPMAITSHTMVNCFHPVMTQCLPLIRNQRVRRLPRARAYSYSLKTILRYTIRANSRFPTRNSSYYIRCLYWSNVRRTVILPKPYLKHDNLPRNVSFDITWGKQTSAFGELYGQCLVLFRPFDAKSLYILSGYPISIR